LRDRLTDPEANARVRRFVAIADEVGCTAAQLALAWTASNPHVSTVLTGATRVEQVYENLGALEVMAALTPERREAIEGIFPLE
jgi:aryl-alcohol dehydrogenase-like predicted oxidoreductase